MAGSESPVTGSIWSDLEDDDEADRYSEQSYGGSAALGAGSALPVADTPERDELAEEMSRKRRREEELREAEKRRRVPFTENGCKSVFSFKRMNKIDEGGYGVVYRVKHQRTGEVMALKKVKFHPSLKDEGFPITALRELELLMSIDHPNIVGVHEIVVGESMDDIYMAMEYVEHDLRSLMEQRKIRFTSPQVKNLMLQLLAGISYLHNHFMLHRDIKTGNLLLNNAGILKICDFGMARPYSDPLGRYTPPNHVVTLSYRPPEGLMGETCYGPEMDMWSIGCIYAELLSNEVLFKARGEAELLTMMCQLLGTPNNDTWPGWSELQFVKTWSIKEFKAGKLREKFPASGFEGNKVYLTEKGGFDLLKRLLSMCPQKRITAAQAMNHGYFAEEPTSASQAEISKFLVMLPSLHEREKQPRKM
eukprot:TRINITY_DN33134_c0_g1_i1.p1 TRINITY_DN33134_c0_g1~~TRINITY_DN33134_c0_g1_i1.p1  ORF type:complete len:427 (+),score=84.86 TRINITY_DN33134_c0_g1_i1:22-1281(+)